MKTLEPNKSAQASRVVNRSLIFRQARRILPGQRTLAADRSRLARAIPQNLTHPARQNAATNGA